MITAEASSVIGSHHSGSDRAPRPTDSITQTITAVDASAAADVSRRAHGFQSWRWSPVASSPRRQPRKRASARVSKA